MKIITLVFVLMVLTSLVSAQITGLSTLNDDDENGNANQERQDDDNGNNSGVGENARNKIRNLTKEEIKATIQERNRIHFENKTGQNCTEGCKCTGVVMKCELENGVREMTIYAGNSGNIIFQVKEINASTQVTLYKNNETGKMIGVFRNNETKEIILPDEVKERIREKILKQNKKAIILNENITLNEDGNYQIRAMKKTKFFFFFTRQTEVEFEVDAETGETTEITE